MFSYNGSLYSVSWQLGCAVTKCSGSKYLHLNSNQSLRLLQFTSISRGSILSKMCYAWKDGCPTWFELITDNGGISSRSRPYQRKAFAPSSPCLGLGTKNSPCFFPFWLCFHSLAQREGRVWSSSSVLFIWKPPEKKAHPGGESPFEQSFTNLDSFIRCLPLT